MNSPQNTSHEPGAFMAWGAVAGGLLGVVIGRFTDHWFVTAIALGGLGLIIGALIDRGRR